jgi:hypothetical protein
MTDATAVLSAAAPVAEGEFRIGRVFGRTANLLSRNAPTYVAVTATAALPGVLLAESGEKFGEYFGEYSAYAAVAWVVLAVVLALAVSTLSQAVVVHAAFQDMCGRPVRLFESLRVGSGRLLVIVGLALGMGFFVGIGLLLLIVPGVILLIMWAVATPACVVERLGVGASMARSSALTQGHRWQIFGMLVLVGFAEGIAGAGVKAALGLAGSAGLVIAGTLLWNGLSGAFSAVLGVATYHDLRVAKEGVDTRQIAAVFD